MAEYKDKSQIPYFMLNTGDNNYEDYTYQYQGPDYNNYQNNYGNEQYNNAYGNYFGGYGPNCGFNQNFPPPYHGFYGFPPFQYPPGPPQEPQEAQEPQEPQEPQQPEEPQESQAVQGPQEPQEPQEAQGLPDSSCNVAEQSFGKNGPPVRKKQTDDKNIKALIRCGIPKENLKNLPRNLLKRYHPEFCGLCSQSFDTMTMSRLHYICKNHLKNQKKWLSQQTDSGYRRNKELPLRARELYCEICDVHITSKVHSESHYAGKSHRAIVEGRKNPKNPFLMQRGMEDRLEQLIRREKKHLRTGDGEAPEKDWKAMQPELCCEICDTAVTCSEQMIMHLNGKRHLAKEKHYIFKMMKGDGLRIEKELRKSEKEKLEFEKRPDSWDELRKKLQNQVDFSPAAIEANSRRPTATNCDTASDSNIISIEL